MKLKHICEVCGFEEVLDSDEAREYNATQVYGRSLEFE